MPFDKIWKFPLKVAKVQRISVPAHFRGLSVGLDRNGQPCFWAAVNTKSGSRAIEIVTVATGGNMPHVGDYLGSVNMDGYIWHYFTGPGDSADMDRRAFHYETKDNGKVDG